MNLPISGQPGTLHRSVTPELLRTIGFNRVAKGYRIEEVDAFLNAVAGVLAEAETERQSLRAEVHRLRNWYRTQGAVVDPPVRDGAPVPPPPHAWHARALAEQAAWRLRSDPSQRPGDRTETERLAEWTRAYGYALETHLRSVAEAFAYEAARLAGEVRAVEGQAPPESSGAPQWQIGQAQAAAKPAKPPELPPVAWTP